MALRGSFVQERKIPPDSKPALGCPMNLCLGVLFCGLACFYYPPPKWQRYNHAKNVKDVINID